MSLFKGKPVDVKVTGDARIAYEELNKIVGEEKAKGIVSSPNQTLFNSIKQKIDFIRINPEYGTHIPKNLIPRDYINNYDINNLWKVNITGAWRIIYTLKGSEVEIIALILDIFSHKDYDKKFGYK